MQTARNGWQQFQQRTPAWSPLKRALVAASAGIIAVCLVCAVCSSIGQAMTGGSKAVANTVKPTATIDSAAAYRAFGTADSLKLADAANTISTDCTEDGSLNACRDAVGAFKDTVKGFQADLDAHPAPACMKTADGHLRAALTLYATAANLMLDGLDTLDADSISKATKDITDGTAEMKQATDLIKTAKC
jgi:spore coat protein U-like protein